MTRAAAARAGIDPALFERQIDQESGYRQDVIDCRRDSSAGARGIAQIVPRWHPNVNPCDPEQALEYAAQLMRQQLQARGGDWALALSNYNAGAGGTDRFLRGEVEPYAETVAYVASILTLSRDEVRRRLTGQGQGAPVEQGAAIRARVIELGKAEIGKRYAGPVIGEPDSYRWGNPGWDCSSFVASLYSRATNGQVKLVAYTDAAYDQSEWTQNPQPGDIVFYFYDDEQAARIPHMGIWLSPTEVLDARYPEGVGIHPHVTPVGPDSRGRYRQTMRPKALAQVTLPVEPPPPLPAPPDPRDAEIAHLKRLLDTANSNLGVATVEYVKGLRDLADALEALKP